MASVPAAASICPNLAWADPSWKQAFDRALVERPWLIGWKGTDSARLSTAVLELEGKVPAGLKGTFYRNGPAQHQIGDMRYHHWFDGDAMLQAFRIADGKISHQGRMIETEKYKAEKAAGKAIEQTFATALPGMRPPASADAINVANINVLQHAGELLALWEGGSATRIDPKTLDTLGLKHWSDQTKGLPFSAHPRLEPDGTLWNFGYHPQAAALIVYRISPDGKLQDVSVKRLGAVPMVHDFLITKRHIVIVLPPLFFDAKRPGAFLDHFGWKPDEGGRIVLIEKDDLSKMRTIEIPAFWVFHFANAWEDESGIIRFEMAQYDDPSVMFDTFRAIMKGKVSAGSRSRFVRATLDPAKSSLKIDTIAGIGSSEFPRIDPRISGKKNRYTYALSVEHSQAIPRMDTINRIDADSGTVDAHTYSDSEFTEEHIFVPAAAGSREGQGWVMGTTLDYKAKRTTLNILDAEDLESGPIARAHLPYILPLGLHGNFVAVV